MNRSTWKRPVALGLAFTMMLSMTACGGGKDSKGGSSTSLEKDYGDVKDMVFSGEVMDIPDIKGDPGTLVVSGDKIYFATSEWPEYDDGAIAEVDDADGSLDEGAGAEDVSEDGSSIEESAEDSTEAGDSSEENAEDDSKSEEVTEESEEDSASEDASEAEDNNDNADNDIADDNDAVADETADIVGDEEVIPEDYQVITRIYSMNFDCTGVTEICEPELENNEYINNMLVGKDGALKFFTSMWDEKTEKSEL